MTRLGAILTFFNDVRTEYAHVIREHGEHYHSAHEGWAVMFEEVDELWGEVRKKRKNRDPKNMRRECIQIACCALKFALTFGKE
jgi:hypothetical protein